MNGHIIFMDENIPYLDEILGSCGEVHRFNGRNLTRDMLVKSGCDILFVRSTTKVNERLLKGTNVRFVGTATSGIDHIDTGYLHSAGITFADAAGSNANSVAEYVFYGILKWLGPKKDSIKDKKIGIIGYGNIGRIVARYANYFGMQVLVNDPPLKDQGYLFPEFTLYSEPEEIFSYCEIVTNHVPLTHTGNYPTAGLIGSRLIEKMPINSLIIHASRGGVIDEKAMLEISGKINLSMVIDVWENEPGISKELALNTLIATPHIAGYSRDGKLRGVAMMARSFYKFTGIKPDMGPVNNELGSYRPMNKDRFEDPEYIYDIIDKKREFRRDHSALMETLSLTDEERMRAFDNLRKNYPVRRESL